MQRVGHLCSGAGIHPKGVRMCLLPILDPSCPPRDPPALSQCPPPIWDAPGTPGAVTASGVVATGRHTGFSKQVTGKEIAADRAAAPVPGGRDGSVGPHSCLLPPHHPHSPCPLAPRPAPSSSHHPCSVQCSTKELGQHLATSTHFFRPSSHSTRFQKCKWACLQIFRQVPGKERDRGML